MAGRGTEFQLEGNKCKCVIITCNGGKELCTSSTCTTCMACCSPGCDGCKVRCKENEKCKCCIRVCGCKENCYGDDRNGTCKGKDQRCKRCVARKCDTVGGGRCICYQCSCGTQCNGFLCACCYWCNPGKCKRNGTCDGYVLGKCADKCKGHGTYNSKGEPVYVDKCKCGPEGNEKCECFPGDTKCRCIRGKPDGQGNCLIICDLCGKLCSQDSYIHRGTLVVVPLAIAMVLIIVWVKYRDKFRRVFYELRGSFSRAPKHSSAYTNNIVGDKIPEEVNVDRYPAFRPMPFAGLS